MEKRIRLGACFLVMLVSSFTVTGQERWEKDIRAFEVKDSIEMPDSNGILFVGSSSIKGWSSLPQDYPEYNVINRGFGGSQIDDAIYFFDRIVAKYQPRQVVLYSGDNDISAGKSPEKGFSDFKEFATLVTEKLPGSELLFISIKPSTSRWDMYPGMKSVNSKVAQYAQTRQNITYVDVSNDMLNEAGIPDETLLLGDGLHMTPAGYELWAGILEPFLVKE